MKFKITLVFFLIYVQTFAQNLVPNPGFEDTLGCPYQWDGIQMGYAANWFQPTWGTSDLFTSCYLVPQSFNGYQAAHTGIAYAGIIASCHKPFGCDPTNINREYLSVRLLTNLEAGERYYCRFYASRADSVHYAAKFGVLFSDSLHQESTMNLPYTPQFETVPTLLDKVDWTEYQFSFIANGGESFLTIGNFRNQQDSDTLFTNDGGDLQNVEYKYAYYYVDDICVSKDSLNCKNTAGVSEWNFPQPQVVRITDCLGREVNEQPGMVLLYYYSDGTIRKKWREEN
jgi:hypothetical protein